MRALHLIKTGVGATWAHRQMRELVARGVEVHALMPEGPTTELCRQSGVHIHLHDFAAGNPWSNGSRIRAAVADLQPDLINSHFVSTTVMMRAALGRRHPTPRFFHVPGPLHLENPVLRRLEVMTAGPNDYWIASSQAIRNYYLSTGVAPRRVYLAYYGVDPETFQRSPSGVLRRALGVEPDVPLVGMISFIYRPRRLLGHREGIKGHEDLVRAFEMVLERRAEPRLVLVGGPWKGADGYASRLEHWATERLGSSVSFLGTRSDVPALYPDMDVAVHPSHSDNAVAVESMMAGVPTVATSVGGQPDLVRPGTTGWLVPPYRPDLLAQAILEALSDPFEARRRAAAGRERVEMMMDARKNAEDVYAAYREVVAC